MPGYQKPQNQSDGCGSLLLRQLRAKLQKSIICVTFIAITNSPLKKELFMNLTMRISLAGCACVIFALLSPALHAQSFRSSDPEVGVDNPQLSSEGTTNPQGGSNGQRIPQAQAAQTKSGNHLTNLAGSLGLTQEQKNFLEPLIQKSRFQVMEIRRSHFLSPRQKNARIQEIRRFTMEQIKSILTPEQQRKFREFMARAKERGARNQQQL
jgi:hypothetical protein